MEVKINKEIRNYTEAIFFGLSLRQFIFSGLACGIAVGLYFLLHPYMSMETVSWILCTGSCPMCSVRVCKISWNDSGAVYLGMD